MITNLHFENFRGFADLRLEGLKRVNLVVGRNNAGKTSLLEGVIIVTDPNRLGQMEYLLRFSSGDSTRRYYRWLVRDHEEINSAKLEATGPNLNCAIFFKRSPIPAKGNLPRTIPSGPSKWKHSFGYPGLDAWTPPESNTINARVLPLHPTGPEDLVKLFAQAVRKKGGEERLETLLRTVDDRIRKARVEAGEDKNHLMLDLGLSEMIPLTQAGQGIYRLVTVFSELIGDTPQLCIIDEIENGIHHSLLEQIWTGLAAVAEELEIQLFVTTHSQECIESAHTAFSKRKEYDFSIVQLFRVPGGVQGRVLDRKHIEAAMAGEIDLR